MKILFLDDNQIRVDGFLRNNQGADVTVAYTAEEAISALKDSSFDLVSLDHDLGGQVYQSSKDENCGMEVVRWIEKNLPEIPTIIVHTWNIPAGVRMSTILRRLGYESYQIPFSDLP